MFCSGYSYDLAQLAVPVSTGVAEILLTFVR